MNHGSVPGGTTPDDVRSPDEAERSVADLIGALKGHLRLLFVVPLSVGVLAFGASSLIQPTFTAEAALLPPQQGQSATASVLAGLGPLAGLATGSAALRGSGEQYVALMSSVTVSDRIIDRFDLVKRYESEFRQDARRELKSNVRISLGKKDGLITVQVDDHSPQVAAGIANQYVDELRRMTATLAVTEAQQRRLFFERQLDQVRQQLARAQQELQASGFSLGALKSEPRAAAENYARLKAGIATAEVRLQSLRGSLTESAPEVRQQMEVLGTLRRQLAQTEQATDTTAGPDYVGRYREYKYQEALFDAYARQLELARVDESREGAIVQVVDTASLPERKSKPKRAQIAVSATLGSFALLVLLLLLRRSVSKRTNHDAAGDHQQGASEQHKRRALDS